MTTIGAAPHRSPPVREAVKIIRPGEGENLVEIIIIHPGALPVDVYHQAAGGLAPNVRVLALDLQSIPLYWGAIDAGSADLSVEQIADAIWPELARVSRSELPLLLLGWSFGGVLAFELMRRKVFEARRTELVLGDSIAPIASLKREGADLGSHRLMQWFTMYLSARRGQRISAPANRAKNASHEDRLEALLGAAIKAGAMHADTSLHGFRKVYDTFHLGLLRNNRICNPYQPPALPCSAVLIKARRSLIPYPFDLGWKRLVNGRLARLTSPGDHYSMLTDPVAVQWLTDALGYLAECLLAERAPHRFALIWRRLLRRMQQHHDSLLPGSLQSRHRPFSEKTK